MTTYYVDPTSGNDGNAGTSFGAAWLTTQKAADTAVGGDEVRLCATATETPSARIDFDTTAGSSSSVITFVGYNSTGTAELTSGNYYTISGSSLGAGADLIYLNIANLYIRFRGIRFTAGKDDNITEGTGAYYPNFNRCRIDSAADDNIYITTTTGGWTFVNCEIDSAGGQGMGVNAGGRGNCRFIGCKIHDNTGIGLEIGGDAGAASVVGCEIYDNGGDGISLNGAHDIIIGDNTFYANDGDALALGASLRVDILNNSFSLSGAYGIDLGTGTLGVLDFNHYYTNTSGELSSGSSSEINKQTGDPTFVSVTDGSEDFTPDTGSPLIQNGLRGSTIGAVSPVDGGGGVAIVNARRNTLIGR